MKALMVAEDGSAKVVDLEPKLGVLQAQIGGGYLEGVSIGAGWHAYVDEEGKLKRLGLNMAATMLLVNLGWPRGDMIFGPALFLGDGMAGAEAEVPAGVLAMARELGILADDPSAEQSIP